MLIVQSPATLLILRVDEQVAISPLPPRRIFRQPGAARAAFSH
jgi:hypothetical protein